MSRPSNSRSVPWLRRLTGWLGRRLRGEQAGVPKRRASDHRPVAPGVGRVLRRAHGELQALLDAHPDTRQLMRHLDYVERALTRYGSRALDRVPPRVLSAAVAQLDKLAGPAPGAGLTALRGHLLSALRTPERSQGPVSRPMVSGHDSDLSEGLQVSEASHSLFDEMERSWTGQLPAGYSAQALAGLRDDVDSVMPLPKAG